VFLNNDIRMTRRTWLAELVHAVEPGVLAGPLRIDPHAWVDGQPIPYLDGWCLAGMAEDLSNLGGFDETLEEPAYFSDNLLCLEARVAGMTLREVHVGLFHMGSRTSLPGENPEVHAVTARNREKYMARARQVLSPVTR
jgi:GT2 family glycosyltransferase